MDLGDGQIIVKEEPGASGFCPVGFDAPDWWDIHSERELPGSMYWTKDSEWPQGDFGFVWGCIWGDDSSWKVQYLDLSSIHDGFFDEKNDSATFLSRYPVTCHPCMCA